MIIQALNIFIQGFSFTTTKGLITMQKFSNINIARINLANLALGRDKMKFEDRLNFNMNEVYKAIDGMTDIGDILQALSALECYKDALNGVFSIPVESDTNSSMMLIMGCITRDVQSLEYVGLGADVPQRTYTKLEAEFRKDCAEAKVKIADELDDFKHQGAIPYGYAGDSCIKRLIGQKAFKVWEQTYAKCLPGCAKYRQACLDAWNPHAFAYQWSLPDGYQVVTPVLGDGKKFGVNIGTYRVEYNMAQNEPRPTYIEKKNARGEIDYVRNPKTKALGANTIHSLDAYALREIARRCNMTKGRALEILQKCKKSIQDIQDFPELARLEECVTDMGIISARWFYLLEDNPVRLPKGIEAGLERLAKTLGNNSFDLMVIHDAFGCTCNHVNYLRKTANQVFADFYAGNMMQYFSRQLRLDVEVQKFDKAIYQKILDSDYLVH